VSLFNIGLFLFVLMPIWILFLSVQETPLWKVPTPETLSCFPEVKEDNLLAFLYLLTSSGNLARRQNPTVPLDKPLAIVILVATTLQLDKTSLSFEVHRVQVFTRLDQRLTHRLLESGFQDHLIVHTQLASGFKGVSNYSLHLLLPKTKIEGSKRSLYLLSSAKERCLPATTLWTDQSFVKKYRNERYLFTWTLPDWSFVLHWLKMTWNTASTPTYPWKLNRNQPI